MAPPGRPASEASSSCNYSELGLGLIQELPPPENPEDRSLRGDRRGVGRKDRSFSQKENQVLGQLSLEVPQLEALLGELSFVCVIPHSAQFLSRSQVIR